MINLQNLTIVIPTIGRKSLLNAVNSALNITPNVIVVVDSKFKCNLDFEGVKVIEGGDGPAENKNLGISKVTTEYFMVLDDDDVITSLFGYVVPRYFGFYDYIIPGYRRNNNDRVIPLTPEDIPNYLYRYSDYSPEYMTNHLILPDCIIIKTEVWHRLQLRFEGTKWDDVIPMTLLVSSVNGLWINKRLVMEGEIYDQKVTNRSSDPYVLSKVSSLAKQMKIFNIVLTNLLEQS